MKLAKFIRAFNGWATIAWIVLLVPSLLWWKESVPWLVIMSLWANVVGHGSAWVAARSDVSTREANGSQEMP